MTDQKPVAAAQPVAAQPSSPHPAKQAGGGEVAATPQAVQYLNAAILEYLDQLFKSYASAEHSWGPRDTSNFFTNIQHDASIPAPAQTASQAPAGGVQSADFDFHAFLDYMSSPASGVIGPATEQDLSYPLSSYFISSSHNTYLTGNQLSSDASTDAYRNVLLRGCRCIEIDVWDGEAIESDSDSSVSTSSGDDGVGGKDRDAKKQKNAERLERARSVALSVKESLPSELAARLEKTKLGKRFERFVGKKMDAKPSGKDSAAATTANTAPAASPATGVATPQTPSVHRTVSAAGEPRVLHGHTLTKEVSFRAVCQVIRDNAFIATDLPLVVSLEVHCNAQQQQLMVNIMKETWGGMLLPEPAGDALQHERPSPDDLRKKILIKVKYVKPSDVPTQVPPTSAGTDAAPEGKELAKEVKSEAKIAGNSELEKAADRKKKTPSKIIQALSELGIYTRGVSFKSLSQPEATMPGHVFSVSENGIIEVHERDRAGLFHHNQHFLMRAYPSGLRFLSTNLDPVPYWRKGVQMVALNWQVWDEGMMLNEGMFAGSKGYVLKPEGYRAPKLSDGEDKATETSSIPPPPKETLDLKIEILAAQNLGKGRRDIDTSSFHPFVRVDVHVEDRAALPAADKDCELETGVVVAPSTLKTSTTASSSSHSAPRTNTFSAAASQGRGMVAAKIKERQIKEQEKEGQYKLRTRASKGSDPDFGGEELHFSVVPGVVPELVFVRFVVRAEERMQRDSLVGWSCVRLDRLKQGYRFVHLLDDKGMQTDAVLLVKVTKTFK